MWVGSMTLKYANYILWAHKEVRISVCCLYIHANTCTFGWNYIPGTIHGHHCSSLHQKHCLSRYYLLKILFKATLSLKISTLFSIILASASSYFLSFFP
jgi:hypothetical protein